MRAPEVDAVEPLKLGRYAVLGILALALSLAGVMGGHQLLGAAFGTGDPEDGLGGVPAAEGPGCPPALQVADACDYDGDGTPPGDHGDRCDGVLGDGVAAAADREGAAPAPSGGR